MSNAFLAGLVCLAAVACSSVEPSPSLDPLPNLGYDFAVPWSQEHFGAITIYVNDQSDLVWGAQKLLEAGAVLGNGSYTAVVDPERSTLTVAWLGGVCRFGPTVTVTGDSSDLVVSIRPDEGAGLPPGTVCSGLGVFYGVRLNLAMRVEQDAVDAELVR